MLNDQGGVITWLAVALGLMPQPVFLLGQPSTALPTAIVVAVGYGHVFMAAPLLAGMQSIGEEYFEAAKIEGASTLQQFRYVTLALLRPVIVIILYLRGMREGRFWGDGQTAAAPEPSLTLELPRRRFR